MRSLTEIKQARLEQIAWASKFHDEQNNAQKWDWMQAYVELVDAVEEWKELSDQKEVAELLAELNEVEFLRILGLPQKKLLDSEPLMEEPLKRFEEAALNYITAPEVKAIVKAFNDQSQAVKNLPTSGKFNFYQTFESVPHPTVLYEVALPPSNFEGTDTMTFVISIPERRVIYLIGHNGFPIFLNESQTKMTEEDWEGLGLED